MSRTASCSGSQQDMDKVSWQKDELKQPPRLGLLREFSAGVCLGHVLCDVCAQFRQCFAESRKLQKLRKVNTCSVREQCCYLSGNESQKQLNLYLDFLKTERSSVPCGAL